MTLQTIFKAYDVRATYPDKINEDAAWKVGFAAGVYFMSPAVAKDAPACPLRNTVVVSRDMRPHSPSLSAALIEGLRAAGRDVIDLGMCDTSFQYFAVNHLGTIGGIQTTASHNPINYNGFKISGPLAKPVGAKSGLNDIRDLAVNLKPDRPPAKGRLETRDLWSAYRAHILKFLKLKPTDKFKAFVDASNGMAGKMIPLVFKDVPGLEIVPVNFEINGSFVHEPNPLVAENMVSTQQGVVKHKGHLGACFDGDADRCILTDEKGQIIGCDHLTALLAEYFLQDAPGAAVVYDLRSSKAVEETIRRLKGKPQRSQVGHVFMKALLREVGGIFGGELSGHFYFRDNFFADSGAIAFAAVLSAMSRMGKPLSQLIAPLKKYPQSGEMNFQVEDKAGVLVALKSKYAGIANIDELDGVTVDAFAKLGWWCNVRASNTEPLLRFNGEARDDATLKKMLAEVTPMLGKPATGGH